MARVAYAMNEAAIAAAIVELALVPLEEEAEEAWSIEQEPMGAGWHDSSWMLRRGLDVIELTAMDSIPAEWQRRWRLPTPASRGMAA